MQDGDELFDIKYDDGFTGRLYRYECEPLLVHPSNHLQGIPSMTPHGDTIHCVGDCCTSTQMMMHQPAEPDVICKIEDRRRKGECVPALRRNSSPTE